MHKFKTIPKQPKPNQTKTILLGFVSVAQEKSGIRDYDVPVPLDPLPPPLRIDSPCKKVAFLRFWGNPHL